MQATVPGESMELRGFWPYAEAGTLTDRQSAFLTTQAGKGVVGQQEVPVEVKPIGEGRKLGGGADSQGTFDHAAQHDLRPGGAGNMDHFEGLANSAALAEFD